MGIGSLRQAIQRASLSLGVTLFLGVGSQAALAEERVVPESAQDLRYGEVLYEYHQGRSFEALSLLNVAKMKNGIQHHGDHPSLVEGGLMLAYGMTREAKKRFESVLQEQVSPESRNAAWYYLGKVFYLEQDDTSAVEALAQVDEKLLAETKSDLHQEWLYLRTQLKLKAGEGLDQALPEEALWSAYISYNQAVMLAATDLEQAKAKLVQLIDSLKLGIDERTIEKSERGEARALMDQCRLTLGQWAMRAEDYTTAMQQMQAVRFDSMLSDEALFQYAVAATHLEKHGLALEALNTLQARESFTPWLQQVPYALAYLYEQMKELPLALQAYQTAGEYYDKRLVELKDFSAQLTEDQIIQALQFDSKSIEADAVSQKNQRVELGVNSIRNDAYGHIRVQPVDFKFAYLLSLESFQLGLRDLHELYKLRNSLDQWQTQLDSFDVMLDTRATQRNMRVNETQAALEEQKTEQWQSLQALYTNEINKALAQEDLEFFMDEDQIEFKAQIDQVYENLQILSDDGSFLDEDEIAEYKQKIDRMNAYFQWWIADSYGVNRWAAEGQLRQLDTAMDEFNARHQVLKSELASDDRHNALQQRVTDGKTRLASLSEGIELALNEARQHLISLVQAELDRQHAEVAQYMRVSKRAEARIADVLYHARVSGEQEKSQSGAQPEIDEPMTNESSGESGPAKGSEAAEVNAPAGENTPAEENAPAEESGS